jgi:hypothetical protein
MFAQIREFLITIVAPSQTSPAPCVVATFPTTAEFVTERVAPGRAYAAPPDGYPVRLALNNEPITFEDDPGRRVIAPPYRTAVLPTNRQLTISLWVGEEYSRIAPPRSADMLPMKSQEVNFALD